MSLLQRNGALVVECLKLASFSGTRLTQVHTLSVPLLLYQVPITVGAIYHTGGWFGRALSSPLLILPARSMVEGHRYLALYAWLTRWPTLRKVKESWGQGYDISNPPSGSWS